MVAPVVSVRGARDALAFAITSMPPSSSLVTMLSALFEAGLSTCGFESSAFSEASGFTGVASLYNNDDEDEDDEDSLPLCCVESSGPPAAHDARAVTAKTSASNNDKNFFPEMNLFIYDLRCKIKNLQVQISIVFYYNYIISVAFFQQTHFILDFIFGRNFI